VTESDVLPAFRGTTVHDALSVYNAYPQAWPPTFLQSP
jgi:hypothetical protein